MNGGLVIILIAGIGCIGSSVLIYDKLPLIGLCVFGFGVWLVYNVVTESQKKDE